MKRIITSAVIILTIGSTFILSKEKTQAQEYCWVPTSGQDPANHSEAYSDGHRQGVESASKGEQYRERVVGGEFARGFKDGYQGRYNPSPTISGYRCNRQPLEKNPAIENVERHFKQEREERRLREFENRRKK